MARYSDDQLSAAKMHLARALESVAVAFWTDEERFQATIERPLSEACSALGFRIVPDIETEKEGAA